MQDHPIKGINVENHVSGDKPETLHKATHVKVVTGNQIVKKYGTK